MRKERRSGSEGKMKPDQKEKRNRGGWKMRTKTESGDENEVENGNRGEFEKKLEKVGRRTKNGLLRGRITMVWLQRKSPKISSENPLQEK